MAEGNRNNTRLPQASNSNPPWSFQHFHRSSHNIATSATQRIQDLQYYVVQGLSPLINSSTVRSQNGSHNHPWPRSRIDTEENRASSNQSSTEVPNQDYVIDMDNGNSETNQETPPSSSANGTIDNALRNLTDSISELDNLRTVPEYQMLLGFLEKYVPFFFILLMKLVFDHKLGILSILGLFFTFFHANSVVKREVAKQGKRRIMSLIWVSFNLSVSIYVIYGVLSDKGAATALIFIPPYTSTITIWDVLWIVSITDFVIRMLGVLIKLFILALPAQLVAFHRKGNHYLFVESTSQLYRTLAPMQHWLYFFSESYTGPSKVFGFILSAAYLIFKCKNILSKAKMWKRTFFKIIQSKTYGVSPSVSQIKEAGQSCPICQDDYKFPAMLQCKHIFCEDCVALWFDRERTCPLCRAQIADDPTWRDGSTSLALQIF